MSCSEVGVVNLVRIAKNKINVTDFISERMAASGHILCSHVHCAEFVAPECCGSADVEVDEKRIYGTHRYTYFATKFP